MNTLERLAKKRSTTIHQEDLRVDANDKQAVVKELVALCSDRQVMTSLDVANAINIYDELLAQLDFREKTKEKP
jgi:hypothetical protein